MATSATHEYSGLTWRSSPGVLSSLERLTGPHWRLVKNVRPLAGRLPIHLMIGASGVYAITAERHDGEVRIDGNQAMLNSAHTSVLSNALTNAEAASGVLSGATSRRVTVTPVLILDGCGVAIKRHPTHVHVLRARSAARWFRQRRNGTKGMAEMAEIECAARQASLWTR